MTDTPSKEAEMYLDCATQALCQALPLAQKDSTNHRRLKEILAEIRRVHQSPEREWVEIEQRHTGIRGPGIMH